MTQSRDARISTLQKVRDPADAPLDPVLTLTAPDIPDILVRIPWLESGAN